MRKGAAKSPHDYEPVEGKKKKIGEDIGHVAAETFLLTRLTFRLLSYLGLGYRWVSKLIALFCYAILLLPGFLQVACFYYYSGRIHRSIIYGDQPRNRLDLYLPLPCQKPKPVVIFVIGGAWIIGYKAWGSFLGLQLAERGIIVACLDYRNFPQGTISDMVKDVSQGISFVFDNIVEYGGDPNRVYLMGQSAGAHISACALLAQAAKETHQKKSDYCCPSWSVLQLKGYFGLSGGYNLPRLVDHFDRRGLYRSIFLSIMEGEDSLQRYSPELMVQELSGTTAFSKLPPIALFHGTADCSIPCDSSKSFADTLKSAGANAEMILYRGKTHTDLFIQDPLRGGRDELLEDLVTRVQHESEGMHPVMYRRMVPEPLLKMARKVSPF